MSPLPAPGQAPLLSWPPLRRHSLSLSPLSPLQLTWPQLSHHQREINIHIRAQTKYLDHLASLLSASYFSAHSLESREPLQRHVNLLLLQIKLHLEVMVVMVVMVVAGFRGDLRACLSITIIRCLSSFNNCQLTPGNPLVNQSQPGNDSRLPPLY